MDHEMIPEADALFFQNCQLSIVNCQLGEASAVGGAFA